MKNKSPLESMPKLIMTITIIVLVGALFGTLGYYLGNKNIAKNTPADIKYQKDQLNKINEKETRDNDQEDTAFLEKIADWTTYSNEEYGFEIKYPENVKKVYEKDTEIRFDLSFDSTNYKYLSILYVEPGISPKCVNPLTVSEIIKRENVELSGVEFVKEIGSEGAAGSIYNSISYSKKIDNKCFSLNLVVRSDTSKTINLDKESKVFNDMISTFKLTNTDEISDLETYNGSKIKIGSAFSFKYSPEVWNLEEINLTHEDLDGCILSPGVLWRNRLVNIISSEDIVLSNYEARKVKIGAENNASGINYYFDSETSAVFSLSVPENKKDKATCEKDTETILNTISF